MKPEQCVAAQRAPMITTNGQVPQTIVEVAFVLSGKSFGVKRSHNSQLDVSKGFEYSQTNGETHTVADFPNPSTSNNGIKLCHDKRSE